MKPEQEVARRLGDALKANPEVKLRDVLQYVLLPWEQLPSTKDWVRRQGLIEDAPMSRGRIWTESDDGITWSWRWLIRRDVEDNDHTSGGYLAKQRGLTLSEVKDLVDAELTAAGFTLL